MKTLQEFYDSLPEIDCKGLCSESCGVIPLGDDEAAYIEAKYGKEGLPEPDADLICSNLDRERGKCTIHDRRPLICRLWGLVKHPLMRCPHGCKPERWVPKHKADKLINIISKEGIDAEGNQ